MAALAKEITPVRVTDSERVVDFAPVSVRAPFVLRCAALAIDYMAFLVLPVAWLILNRFLDDGSTKPGLGDLPWILGAIVAVGDMIILPIARGRSVGKILTGLTIVRTDGRFMSLGNLILRNVVGYALTIATCGLGFLLAALTPSGRALHDYVGGTVVVRGRKTPVI